MANSEKLREILVDLPFITACVVISLDWMVAGHMQSRVYHDSGKMISKFRRDELRKAYRQAQGEDYNYRFAGRSQLMLPICILAWVLTNAFVGR